MELIGHHSKMTGKECGGLGRAPRKEKIFKDTPSRAWENVFLQHRVKIHSSLLVVAKRKIDPLLSFIEL